MPSFEKHTPYLLWQKTQKTCESMLSNNGPLALAKAGLIPPTQPLQVVMRTQQAALRGNNNLLSMMATMRYLYQQEGLRAFFKGVTPATAKEGGKYLLYKGPLLSKAPQLVESALPKEFETLPLALQGPIKAVLAGAFSAGCDTLLGGGLEAYATYRSTSQGSLAQASFSAELAAIRGLHRKVARIYQGAVPATAKGTLAFATFFGAAGPIKKAVKRAYNITEEGPPPVYVTGTAAIATGSLVASTASPLDIVKTLKQMPNGSNKGLRELLVENVSKHGIKGLTAGLGTKALLITFGWSVNFFVLNHFGLKKPPVAKNEFETAAPVNQEEERQHSHQGPSL